MIAFLKKFPISPNKPIFDFKESQKEKKRGDSQNGKGRDRVLRKSSLRF